MGQWDTYVLIFLCVRGHTNMDIKIAVRKLAYSNLHTMTQWEAMDHLATAEGGCLIYQQPSHHFKRLSIHLPYGLLSSRLTLYEFPSSMWNKAA